MTAISAMRKELDKIGSAMSECVTEEGVVKTSCRYRYQLLCNQATAFKKSIEWMESQVLPKPKYIYDDRYDEKYPADGIYDRCCRSCGRMVPIEDIDEEGWCKECVENEEYAECAKRAECTDCKELETE